ncbi:MAG TPA: EamA family transporter [Thermaerobacter sp.]
MGYLYVLAAAVLWGTLGIWARLAYDGNARPNDVVFFRALIAFLVALWVARHKAGLLRAAARSRLWLLVAYGTVSVGLFYLSYFWAVRLLPVAVAAVLLYTAPVFVALMARFFLGEALAVPRLVALVVALLGVALISGLGGAGAGDGAAVAGSMAAAPALPPVGVLVGLLAGLTYATYTIFGKVAVRDLDPDVVVVYTLGVGTLFLFITLPPPRLLALDFMPGVWPVLVLLGVGPTYLAYRLYTHGLREVPASTAAIVAMVEPVVAAVLGWVLLRETLTAAQVAGGVLVLLGAALARIQPARQDAASPGQPG